MTPRRVLAAIAIGLLAGFGGFLAWAHRPAIAPIAVPPPASFAPALVARGAALARIGDCRSCHSVVPIAEHAGGRPLTTPFGTLYGANITPDPDKGIGHWSLAAFARALREGVSRGGDHLYPAFPYDHFTGLSDGDVAALYAFVMTRRPVHADPPPNRLMPPLAWRPLQAGWKLLFFRPARLRPDPAMDPLWNRGAYLAEGVAHCASCHTPRGLLGDERDSQAYRGGKAEGWTVPPLTGRSGSERWTAGQIETYLRTGRAPDGKSVAGPMADVVANLALAPAPDVHAIALYIAWWMGRQPGAAATAAARR